MLVGTCMCKFQDDASAGVSFTRGDFDGFLLVAQPEP